MGSFAADLAFINGNALHAVLIGASSLIGFRYRGDIWAYIWYLGIVIFCGPFSNKGMEEHNNMATQRAERYVSGAKKLPVQ